MEGAANVHARSGNWAVADREKKATDLKKSIDEKARVARLTSPLIPGAAAMRLVLQAFGTSS